MTGRRRRAVFARFLRDSVFGLGLLVLPLTAAHATTYFVRPGGSDSGCTGTSDADYPGSGTGQACAFATPFRAGEALSALPDGAHSITVHAGTYTTCSAHTFAITNGITNWGTIDVMLPIDDVSGSSSASRIVVRCAGDGPCVLDPPQSGCEGVIAANRTDYLTIGGTGTNQGFVIGDGASPCTSSCGGKLATSGIAVHGYDAGGIKILGNTLRENTTGVCTNTNAESALLGTEGGWSVLSTVDIEIAYNTLELGCDYYGIHMNPGGCGDNGTCSPSNGSIHHNRIVEPNTGRRHYPIFARGTKGLAIHSNYIELGNDGALGASDSKAILLRDNQDIRVFDNHVYFRCGGSCQAIYLQDHNNDTPSESHEIYNNTFYGQGAACLTCAGTCDNIKVRNNICEGQSSDYSSDIDIGFQCGGASGGNWGHNQLDNITLDRWYGSGSCSTDCSGRLTCDGGDLLNSDAAFTRTGGKPVPYFQLQSSSPGIDKGLAAGPASFDYDGEQRTAIYDIGADEFGGGPPPTDPPGTVPNLHRTDVR